MAKIYFGIKKRKGKMKRNKLDLTEMLILKYRAGGYDHKMIANHLKKTEKEVQKIEKSAIKKLDASLKGI